MDQIVPRWEWRTFGQDFGAAEKQFGILTAENIQTSEEIYFVAAGTDANVKVRDQLVDIKVLEEVDANGLERWRPVLKAPFPVAGSVVAQVRAALGLPADPAQTEDLTLDRLTSELAPPGGPVHVIHVHKTRSRYRVDKSAAEMTDVVANGREIRTVAIEDADPAKVIAAVRAMGLAGYKNTSYPRGLRELIGLS
jgi:exopolyphosphatase/guanosine-5'-triphosphate,3'-diphosphate pyrophosphatase